MKCDRFSIHRGTAMEAPLGSTMTFVVAAAAFFGGCGFELETVAAAGGVLTLTAVDEASGDPATTRLEIVRSDKPNKPMPIRLTVPAGMGVVMDRSLELTLPDGGYTFRMIRGPEYRIITGNFVLEKTSLDDHNVELPRMVDMRARGWTSGDCLTPSSPYSLPLRMVSEDLHVAAVLGHVAAKPIPRRDHDDPPIDEPQWIREDAQTVDGLAIYGPTDRTLSPAAALASEAITAFSGNPEVKFAIENPFAWPLPIWLSSDRIDGLFVLGDWLKLDRRVTSVKDGRDTQSLVKGTNHATGQWAERIYWNVLEAGFRVPPMAGSGDNPGDSPVGYNRLYAADPLEGYEENDPAIGDAEVQLEARPVTSEANWWRAVWNGRSVVTNGPMLRPTLDGHIPGHVFTATSGEALELHPEIRLAVRDPVDYLEVVHNGEVHHKARLDEFAKAGGVIPSLVVRESGWVVIRVITLFDDHYRMATAPLVHRVRWPATHHVRCRAIFSNVAV